MTSPFLEGASSDKPIHIPALGSGTAKQNSVPAAILGVRPRHPTRRGRGHTQLRERSDTNVTNTSFLDTAFRRRSDCKRMNTTYRPAVATRWSTFPNCMTVITAKMWVGRPAPNSNRALKGDLSDDRRSSRVHRARFWCRIYVSWQCRLSCHGEWAHACNLTSRKDSSKVLLMVSTEGLFCGVFVGIVLN